MYKNNFLKNFILQGRMEGRTLLLNTKKFLICFTGYRGAV